jgi:Domain of unknown function(DUF2779)
MTRCHGEAVDAPHSGEVVIKPGLAAALAGLTMPIAHLDFETINPAIPVWAGCRPYDQVPVQFSVHVEGENGGDSGAHFEWLADGAEDPRAWIAHALDGVGSIVVYSQPFEEGCLRELQQAVPELAPR